MFLSKDIGIFHGNFWTEIRRIRISKNKSEKTIIFAEIHYVIFDQEIIGFDKEERTESTITVGKMKIMICGTGLDLPQSSGEYPCTFCHSGVGSNGIFCNGCKHREHKKCNGLKHLTKDLDYRCTWCQGTACPLDCRPQREVQVGPDKLEVVASFCYLGDMLSAAGGCELSTTTHVKTTWEKFKDLLPVLSSCHMSFKTHGRVYSSCAEHNALCQ